MGRVSRRNRERRIVQQPTEQQSGRVLAVVTTRWTAKVIAMTSQKITVTSAQESRQKREGELCLITISVWWPIGFCLLTRLPIVGALKVWPGGMHAFLQRSYFVDGGDVDDGENDGSHPSLSNEAMLQRKDVSYSLVNEEEHHKRFMSNLTPHLVQLAVTLPRPIENLLAITFEPFSYAVNAKQSAQLLEKGIIKSSLSMQQQRHQQQQLPPWPNSTFPRTYYFGDDQPGCSIGYQRRLPQQEYAQKQKQRASSPTLDMPVLMRNRFRIDLGTLRGLPPVSFGLMSPLQLLGAQATVDLLCCALGERKILLHSSNLANITPVAEAVTALMYPLQWSHAYVPILPRIMMEILEAPQPYILGVQSDWLKDVAPSALEEVILVDIDGGRVQSWESIMALQGTRRNNRHDHHGDDDHYHHQYQTSDVATGAFPQLHHRPPRRQIAANSMGIQVGICRHRFHWQSRRTFAY